MVMPILEHIWILYYMFVHLNANARQDEQGRDRASPSPELQTERCQMIGNPNQKPRNQLSRCAPVKHLSDLRLLRLLSVSNARREIVRFSDSRQPRALSLPFALLLSCTESLRDWCLVKCDLQV